MVVTLGFALFERFCPYATWNVLSRVHTWLPLDISAYALRHTLFIIDLAHADFFSSLPSVHTVDTSYLAHQEHILSSTTSSSKFSSSSSSGLPFKDNTQHHIVNKHHFISDLHHLPSPSGQDYLHQVDCHQGQLMSIVACLHLHSVGCHQGQHSASYFQPFLSWNIESPSCVDSFFGMVNWIFDMCGWESKN